MDKIGKYEIVEELGKGGMGVVFKAWDPVIEREVAIKVILEAALNQPEVKERFYREAKSLGKLSHENVTTLHDVGESGGQPYIVMEFLHGDDLRTVLSSKIPLSLEQKLDYALQICRGLKVAHEKNIIHRDIKPENIKVLASGRIKIMDFGIAKPDTGTMTQTGVMLGTPYYMSPEQVRGEKVTKQSDIFAFGALFYELLTSKAPFTGERVEVVLYSIVHEDPEPITLHEPPQVSESLQRIVMKCLAKDREQRYRDFSEIIEDLTRVRDELRIGETRPQREEAAETVTVGPAETLELDRARPKIIRPALLYALAGLVLAVVAGWFGYQTFLADEGVDLSAKAQSARQDMLALKRQAEEADAAERAKDDFALGVTAETRGDQALGEQNWRAAISAYEEAGQAFQRALSEVTMPEEPTRLASTSSDPPANSGSQKEVRQPEISSPNRKSNPPANTEAKSTDIPKKDKLDAKLQRDVQQAEDDMLAARSKVPGEAAQKDADANYQQAAKFEALAQQQSQSGDLNLALVSFQTATDFYQKAQKSVLATLRNQADEAKKVMLSHKSRVHADDSNEAKYQEALTLEQSAGDAYAADRYPSAQSDYATAANLYRDLVNERARRERAFQDALAALTQKFKDSVEKGDLRTLESLFKRFAPHAEKWRNLFEHTKDRVVNIAIENVDRSASQPIVYLSFRLKYIDNKNREQQAPEWLKWTLEPSGDRWLIASSEPYR